MHRCIQTVSAARNADSGALRSTVANYSGGQCQVDVQPRRLQQDIIDLRNSAKRHKNFYEAGNGLASVANFYGN